MVKVNVMSDERAIELFYSYSHKDKVLRNKLETHLTLLKRQGVISSWHDRKISPGSEWKNDISEHLDTADIILLLISPDFLASDYCFDVEVKRAMERHCKGEAVVIPISLRPCDTNGADFMELQGLPTDFEPVTTWKNRDEAFTNIAQGIRKVANSLSLKKNSNKNSLIHPFSSLVILLEQTEKKGYYALYAWFKNGNKPLSKIYPSLDYDKGKGECERKAEFKKHEIVSIIDNILNIHNIDFLEKKEKLAAHREQFTIEFFLPVQLLCEPIEQWELPSTKRALGVDYKLVIRFCDFISSKNKTNSWLNDLQHFCQKHPNILQDINKSGIGWLEQFDPTNNHEHNELRRRLENEGKLFFVLHFSLDKKSFTSLIGLGIPFLFWTRECGENSEELLQQKFNEILCYCKKLEELPIVLKTKRVEIVNDCMKNKTDIVCNLALFWNQYDETMSLMRTRLEAPTI